MCSKCYTKTEEVDKMKQPYRDLKVTGSVVDATVERLLAEREAANAADPGY